jgi:hypothetical protein
MRTPAAFGRGGPHGHDKDHGHGHDHGHGRGGLIPRERLGVQQWSVRDAITRKDRAVQGYLGGRNFPADPSDRGPLTPLPGGFAAVFAYLASVGDKGFEFFSLDQGANGPITTQQIRQALDQAGLVSAGSHQGGLQQMVDPTYRNNQIEIARILGHRMIGTAGTPPTRRSPRSPHGRRTPSRPTRSAGRSAKSASSTSSTPSRTGSASSTTRRTPN